LNGILAARKTIAALLTQAAHEAQQAGKLPSVTLPEVLLEHPQKADHGDYATSYPLKLARALGVNPLKTAKELVALMPAAPEIESIAVAPPGFINFTLRTDWLARQVDAMLEQPHTCGNTSLGEGKRIQIEFVSVNPTGPLHVGHGRGAVLGSALANVLAAAGYQVEKEYYINDAGHQMHVFYNSLYARYRQCLGVKCEMPAEGYQGEYVADLAREIIRTRGNCFLEQPEAEATAAIGKIGLDMVLGIIREDLEALGVNFDVWFSEKSLFDQGQYDKVMALLRKDGYIVEKEGATWFASSALGEDKDNVVVRSDGTPTYFASDIAYHYNKLVERKFDRAIDIWGADHQGHVSRMKAVLAALNLAPERLTVIIAQMVTLRRGAELVKLSKRTGDMITLKEVLAEVGADACRFFFLARSADSQMDFDLELAKKQAPENPVYYVQYAHARIASILKLAEQNQVDYSKGDVALLTTAPEQALIKKMLLLPEIVETAAQSLSPHHLAYYAQELATEFHGFYKDCRVVDMENLPLSAARLKLVAAAKLVLSRTLGLMGLSAPDKM